MKSTGIVRKLDELGRIVIPMEIRSKFKINQKDPIEIYTENNTIILKKYEQTCLFCGNTKNLVEYMDKPICPKCAKKLGHIIS